MGLHRSQKPVISSAESFPLLNNGALILGFPRVVLVDFGIEGDCAHTLSGPVHLRQMFPPVYPPLMPCVPDPQCQLRALPQGHSSQVHAPGLGEGGGPQRCVCVCGGGQSPVKSGCLTKVESIYLLLLFQGKSLQSTHWGIIFNPLRGHLCSFHLSVMKSSGISYSTSLLGRCRVPQQCPGSVDHSPLGKTLPLKLLTVIPGDQNWPRMKGLIPQGK